MLSQTERKYILQSLSISVIYLHLKKIIRRTKINQRNPFKKCDIHGIILYTMTEYIKKKCHTKNEANLLMCEANNYNKDSLRKTRFEG